MFRQAVTGRGDVKAYKLDEMQPVSLEAGGQKAVEEIFADATSDRMRAAGKVLSYVASNPEPKEFVDAARLLIFLKGNNGRTITSSAPRCSRITKTYRRCGAAGFWLRVCSTCGDPAAPTMLLVQRTRAALS